MATQGTVEIIIVGNELLNGTTLDTNSHWLSRQLAGDGAVVTRKTIIGDDLGIISEAFSSSIRRRPDWIIAVGGLGPTYDDKTLQGLGMALGRGVRQNGRALEMLKDAYRRRSEQLGVPRRRITKYSLKMTEIPEGATPLHNSAGSAPGVLATKGRVKIVCLPGVPREMRAIFLEEVRPILRRELEPFRRMEEWVRVTGVGEPRMAPHLIKVSEKYSPEVYVKSHPIGFSRKKSVLRLQVISTSRRDEDGSLRRLLDATDDLKRAARRLGGRVEHIRSVR